MKFSTAFIFLFISWLNGTIMAQNYQSFIQPFHIDIDPMERLLLINFEKDPDSTYIGFEPQVFDDAKNGVGHLIIGWRVDGRVDVYHQPSLHMDSSKYDIAGKGLAHLIELDMEVAHFEVTPMGVNAHYEFKDLSGRAVKLLIEERHPKERKPFGLLAPMGDAAEAPSAMPLVLLHDFYFVRKNNTTLQVSIDGKLHHPDRLPIPMDFTKMYFARYSPDPLIATFNPAQDGACLIVQVSPEQGEIKSKNQVLHFRPSGQDIVLERINYNTGRHLLTLKFEKGFPNLLNMKPGSHHHDHFVVEGDPSTGSISGHYTIQVEENGYSIELIPSGGWKPKINKFSLRFMYSVAKVFKKWPKTYRWSAQIKKAEGGDFHINSKWERI